MSFEIWLAFALTSAALLAIPGPTVLLVVSYVMGRGRASGWATVPGVILGDFTAISLSLLGAGAILQASAGLFTILKIAGAAYLIWLGVKMWRAKPQLENSKTKSSDSYYSMFWNTYMVTTLNPKTIVFFIAFLPQFVVASQSTLPQFLAMGITFLTLALINIVLWVLMVGRMREAFNQPSKIQILNRVGGSFLIGAGLLSAAGSRS